MNYSGNGRIVDMILGKTGQFLLLQDHAHPKSYLLTTLPAGTALSRKYIGRLVRYDPARVEPAEVANPFHRLRKRKPGPPALQCLRLEKLEFIDEAADDRLSPS
jgi:hypothetical protein